MPPRVISIVQEDEWQVTRKSRIEEVQLENGAIRFRAEIQDEGRAPFLIRWFTDISKAARFIENVKMGFDTKGGQDG